MLRNFLAGILMFASLTACERAAPQLVLACGTPISKDDHFQSLVTRFGTANVTYEAVPGPEGSQEDVAVIFGRDPKRRLHVHFSDAAKRSGVLLARVFNGDTLWIGPKQLKMGMTLEEVERLNGKPFSITGFDWDMSGYTVDWMGGQLSQEQLGCTFGARFSPSADNYGAEVSGDGSFRSDLPALRAAKPKVVEFSIGYGLSAPQ